MVTIKYSWGKFSSGKSGEMFSRWRIIFPDEVFPDKVMQIKWKFELEIVINLVKVMNKKAHGFTKTPATMQ